MAWKFTRKFLISTQGSHVCLCPHLRTETSFSYDIRDFCASELKRASCQCNIGIIQSRPARLQRILEATLKVLDDEGKAEGLGAERT